VACFSVLVQFSRLLDKVDSCYEKMLVICDNEGEDDDVGMIAGKSCRNPGLKMRKMKIEKKSILVKLFNKLFILFKIESI
jgi:hypothetical protein